MAFPPEFSSTEKYANRYDLDEISVFMNGDANNPMFFSINGLPSQLSFGKHLFYLSILDSSNLDYRLKQNSRVLFEFKSSNNIVLRSDVSEINQKNGIVTCFVEVLKDPLRSFKNVADGIGTLTVVGTIEKNPSRPNAANIPQEFKNAINYRCTFPIEIRKNLIGGNSPIITNNQHQKKTIAGRFSFVKANISADRNSDEGARYTEKGDMSNPLTGGGGAK